ncbi:hypothetical protein JHK87_022444 [Glycine soja]|nr:hypothetical protein JHK87_022444 [Glycine soja]
MTALELPLSDWEDKWIDVYFDITSASFNELNHLHKELGSCDSHNKHKTENGNDSGKVVGNSVQSVDINKELSLRHVKFDQFKRQQSGSGNADGENFSQQGEEENVDEGEMHKKKKKKKQEVESLHDIHSTVKFGVREADGKHVSSRNPTVEKCSSMLDNLVGSLDLHKVNNSAKGKKPNGKLVSTGASAEPSLVDSSLIVDGTQPLKVFVLEYQCCVGHCLQISQQTVDISAMNGKLGLKLIPM